MTNTRIAAAATALVLGATGLAACNDSEDTTDSVTTPTDGVVSDVSDAVTTGDATAGSTGGTDSTGDVVVSDTAVVSEDPLAPSDAVISDEVVTNSIPADGAAGGAVDDAAGSAATAPTN
ncbi:hypothetical protein QP172_03260 [Corynebacterium coyleae]|uniref:hypothetical protein n=1 Tax=Corynebacterium coyleae TaxID=53374 RepID=UPI00254B27BA|nr:hypothetical protein [Corynebacterium coyleae]MDK6492751.1 hypothetical protein [Corynebacterium coyleae]